MTLEQWHAALLKDGWAKRRIYGPDDQSAEYTRDGYKVQVYHEPQALHISAWGPDGVSLVLRGVYDFADMQVQVSECMRCGRIGETEPVVLRIVRRLCPECASECSSLTQTGWSWD